MITGIISLIKKLAISPLLEMLTSMISVAISSSHSWRTIVVYSDLRLVGRLSRAKISLIVCQIQQLIFSITNKYIQQECLVVLTSAPVHSVGLCLSDRLRVKFQTLRWSLLWTLYFPTWNCTEITDFRWIWLKPAQQSRWASEWPTLFPPRTSQWSPLPPLPHPFWPSRSPPWAQCQQG